MGAIKNLLVSFVSGALPSLQTHLVLLAVAIIAELVVAVGIILESPKEKRFREWLGLVFVFGGVVVSAIFTIGLFVFDEGISGAQQKSIISLSEDNFAMQKAMAVRNIGLFGINGPAPADTWFAGINKFAGTFVLIQSTVDTEAVNLAKQIAFLLNIKGWKAELIGEDRSHVSLSLIEGILVFSGHSGNNPESDKAPDLRVFGTGKAGDVEFGGASKTWKDTDPESQQDARSAQAADALATGLTAAGLGIGDMPVRRLGLPPQSDHSGIIPWFEPHLVGVYVQVGSRPVSATVQWLAEKRGELPQGVAVDVHKPLP